jgi:uncharacterized protein YhhL (DUF1145 family)
MLILYSFLGYVALTRPLTLEANLCTGALLTLVIVHLLECVLYRRLILNAPGNAGWHLLNVFLFGLFHLSLLKKGAAAESTAGGDCRAAGEQPV